jgi:hypothetical protein
VPYPHEKLGRLDGVPAYSFDGGTRLELYTATTTIVVFAADPDVLDQAIADIQLEPDSQAPGQPSASSDSASDLPDPVAGALAGRLACT